MAKVSNWPLNYTWSGLSGNKVSFTQTEISAGITYKGPIVSNQLNGVSHLLSRILQFNQATNGYYHPNMTYHKGNFVTILHTGSDHLMQLESYICINDDNGNGIMNRAPISGASTTEVNGITQYNYGVINSQFWKRVDVGDSQSITPIVIKNATKVQANDTNRFCALLMTIPDINYDRNGPVPERTKKVEADLSLTCKCGNNWSTVNFRIRGKYLRNDNGSYIKPNDYFNMPVPDIYIDDIQLYSKNNDSYISNNYTPSTVPQLITKGNLQSANTNPTADQLMNGDVTPYGFNFAIGYTADVSGRRNWGIYIVSKESTDFELEGSSTIPVSLSQISDQQLTVMNIIPIRPNGGANSYDKLLELVEYDENSANTQNAMLFFSRGQTQLMTARTVTKGKFSCWYILARMQTLSNPSLKEHQGRHTRAYGGAVWSGDSQPYAKSSAGQLIECGLPNIKGEIDLYLAYNYEFAGDLWWIKNDDDNPLFKDSSYTSSSGYTTRIYAHGSSYRVQKFIHNRLNLNAKYVSSIYKDSFADVSVKSISVSRYLKCF